MPSIFKRLTSLNKAAPESDAPEVSLRLKQRLSRVGQQLVAKRKVVSAATLLMLFAWLALSSNPAVDTNTPTQQLLSLPQAKESTTSSPVASAPSNKASDAPQAHPIAIEPAPASLSKPASSHSQPTQLSTANQKAIELALAGQASQATNLL